MTGNHLVAYAAVVDDVFRALADRTRRILIDELAERDDQTLFELCTRLIMRHGLEVSRQAVAKHLDVLERAGLVETRRDGRFRRHTLNRAPLRAAWQEWLRAHVDHPDHPDQAKE
ncbi:metalloregulator ArsR/SmtB family transcription factor [Agromyces bauzanensis]|uniref:Transcriptional regulator n=1 Tax=Agromyces bauzanensis TaxID=1308924 RepID=A0A917UPY2_9MICO|nr:transcriptional regulator [Agromyces bauzanensis]